MTELQLKRKANHLCIRCGRPARAKEDGGFYTKCAECAERDIERSNKYRSNKYRSKPNKYEKKCLACGIPMFDEYIYCPWCGKKQAAE